MWGHWQGGSYVSAYTPERPPTPPHMCCSVNFNAALGILWDPPALSNIDWPVHIDLTIYIWWIESLQAIYNIESADFLQMACWKYYEWKTEVLYNVSSNVSWWCQFSTCSTLFQESPLPPCQEFTWDFPTKGWTAQYFLFHWFPPTLISFYKKFFPCVENWAAKKHYGVVLAFWSNTMIVYCWLSDKTIWSNWPRK